MVIPKEISAWIRKKTQQSGMKGIVLGLSGGIDSSVVAVLAKQALGENMLGAIMPCESNIQDEEHAVLLAKIFDIETLRVDLKSAFNALKQILDEGSCLAEANLKARLRMITLYHIANTKKYLVAGTGNKSEIAVGYTTKYGDSGADILPLGSLLKIQVRELARLLDIPEEIINKPPSAGLWEGQTDEEEMGFTYEELDKIIARSEKNDFQPKTKTELKIMSMMRSSQHKRNLPSVFIPAPEE